MIYHFPLIMVVRFIIQV